MEYLDILKTNLLFQGIDKNNLLSLFNCLEFRKQAYKRNELILTVGNITNEIGLIVSGQALIIKDDYWGNRSIINELTTGDSFGESYACIPRKRIRS